MAFLFKSKHKNLEKAQSSREGGTGSQASVARPAGDKGTGPPTGNTPSSSVNNSLSSLPGGIVAAASPEQANPRRGPSMEVVPDQAAARLGAPPAVQPSNNASLYPWSQQRIHYTTTHPSPFPRYGAAVNATASKEGDIYLMGGLINSSTVKGDLWLVEAGGNMACYPLATTAEGPGPRVGHASLLVGNAFIVYGGDTKMEDSDVLDETLYLLNTSTRQWSRAIPAGPRPSGRYGHSLNILGSKIYVFGGQVEGFFMNDLVAFDLNQLQVPTNRWEMLIRNSDDGGLPVGKVPPPRTNHSIVTFNDRLYLFGGTNGFQWFNDVWSYDPTHNVWAPLDCIGYIPAPREGHAAAIVDDVMYIFGGRTEEGSDLGDLAAFRITTRRWYTFQNMGPSPSPRSGHSMTAHGKNIIVLAGEPSTATEAQDLALSYILDTSKIRYPNDQAVQQAVQQAPPGERITAARRPSTSQKDIANMATRSGSALDHNKPVGPPRESVMMQNGSAPRINGHPSTNGADPASTESTVMAAPGSKLPRASMASAPGPPTQQAAPTPRSNGLPPVKERAPPPAKTDRGFGPPIDTGSQKPSALALQSRAMSPSPKQVGPSTKESPNEPLQNAKQIPKPVAKPEGLEASTTFVNGVPRPSSKARQARQPSSIDSTADSVRSTSIRQTSPPPSTATRQGVNPLVRKGSKRNSQTVALLKELDTAKSRNAWYASELELAKKAGYTPNPSTSPLLDQRATESFDDDDKPLVEALLAMRAELANVQTSIDKQAITAAKQIAEVEKQRDAAVAEAVYAKAKLAAHGGSQNSTPQPDSDGRDVGVMTSARSTDISRKLAAAIQVQRDLKNRLEMVNAELDAEKNGRSLAEDTAMTAQSRITDLETYKQHNSAEVERLKAELHESQKRAREEAIQCAEAVSTARLLRLEKQDLEVKHQEVLGTSREQTDTFESLREAIAASTSRGNLLERKLEEERTERERIEAKLGKLKGEHESQTAELESSTRRLRDAEELAETHAAEAQKHRQAVLAGLEKVASRDNTTKANLNDERAIALQAQLQTTNGLVRKYQQAADLASEKLRSAEERIAGLEAYQEQVSREGMSIRKQLQNTMREVQTLQAANQDLKHQLANQQLETNAAHVQHNTLKDILVERGISPTGAIRTRGLSSPSMGSVSDTARVRDLEQQLASSLQAHEDTKRGLETQAQDSERTYREKLGQLESDYQSAVHYVKGTEKMLKRMKEELAKYKADNTRLKEQLVDSEERSGKDAVPPTWETERSSLNRQIESLQADIKSSVLQLENQMAQVRTELFAAQKERDHLKQSHTDSQRHFTASTERSRAELQQLQQENAQLEKRCQDAEQKVSLLLDQVEHSVDTYRRQSRLPEINPTTAPGHTRNISTDSVSAVSETSLRDRNSMALDNLADELEILRTHWETTRDKNYGAAGSSTTGGGAFDDLKTPHFAEGLGLDSGEWRRRLGEETSEEDGEGEGESDTHSIGHGPPGMHNKNHNLKIHPPSAAAAGHAADNKPGREMGVGLGKENSSPASLTPSKGDLSALSDDATPTRGNPNGGGGGGHNAHTTSAPGSGLVNVI